MSEALYLFGIMLLMLERRIPGPVRERVVVAYIRAKGESAVTNMEDVRGRRRPPPPPARRVRAHARLPRSTIPTRPPRHPAQIARLCKCTGAEGGARPAGYPESYFGRFDVPTSIVDMVVDRLRSDDVYNLVRGEGVGGWGGRGRGRGLVGRACGWVVWLGGRGRVRGLVGRAWAWAWAWAWSGWTGVCMGVGE